MSSVAERVNYMLNSKLSLIMSAALLQSMILLTQVMCLGATNYPHFMGIASHVRARIPGSYCAHGTRVGSEYSGADS